MRQTSRTPMPTPPDASGWPLVTSWPPGSFVPPRSAPVDQAGGSSWRRRIRGVDVATVGCLAAALGWIPLSGLVVGGTGAVLAGALLRRPEVGLLLVPIWIVAGAVMVTGPGQWFLVRLARCRRPTPDEWDRLAAAWREVTEAAGVGGGHYRLWVQPSERLNAFAAIGKIVAVTSHAVAFLPHRQLAAVLAHELGHHLAGHAWSRALTYWCALPARYAGRGVRGFARAIRYLAGGSDGALLLAVLLGGAAALAAVFMAAALMLAVAAVAGWWWLLLGRRRACCWPAVGSAALSGAPTRSRYRSATDQICWRRWSMPIHTRRNQYRPA